MSASLLSDPPLIIEQRLQTSDPIPATSFTEGSTPQAGAPGEGGATGDAAVGFRTREKR
jgi:hypothetical protein